jgi:DNA phosphorothioation-dependent restriction protein DptG
MIEQQNLQNLRESLSIKDEKIGLKHTINRKSKFLPFSTRGTERPKFNKGFKGILGGFTRNITSKKLVREVDIQTIIQETFKLVEVSDEDAPYFEQILRMYLQDRNESMKVFHPHVFLYLPFSDGPEKKGEQEFAKFLSDILGQQDNTFQNIFMNHPSNDLITKLVLGQLNGLEENIENNKYANKIPYISDTFKNDFLFLIKHEDYFKNHYELFLSYYYFFYISQLTLKLSQKSKARFELNNEIYYTLDWETSSKNRKSYTYGYQMIKGAARNLLIDINCLEHLNFLIGRDSLSYLEIKETFDALSEEKQNTFMMMLRDWVNEYRTHLSLSPVNNLDLEYFSLVNSLYISIEEAYEKPTLQGPRNRYALSIEEIGKKFFLKTRGSLGYMLNVSQDLLLLLTALSIKNERKSLKQVFVELEIRGMYFDRYSREEIVKLLDKLNVLDKKSDSGDAQYVKPIL